MSSHAEKVLEYDKLKLLLKKYTLSQLGASRVEELTPSRQIDEIRHQQTLCSESKFFYHTLGGFPLRGLKDISPVLRKVAKPGASLEIDQLLDIGRVAQVAQNVKRAMGKLNDKDLPNLCAIVDNLPTFPEIVESIAKCLSPEGEVHDEASPALRTIRRHLVSTRENLQSKLEAILRSPHHQKAIQENVITSRNDRYVIPIKQDSRSYFPGIVQGQSSSGATVFIEPFSVVELNNNLHQLADEERQEIRRILLSLSDQVREHLPALELALDILGELDFLGAKAQLSIDLNCTEPCLNTRGFLKLTEARHPLLEVNLRKPAPLIPPAGEGGTAEGFPEPERPERIVPIDVYLGEPFHTLVITGPNTGGKTVVLKTVGLLTLMAQSGLHIPAQSGSELAVFGQVFADIGDEQSIEQNLSTFSSHITKIIEILKHADENSLVLLDELGAGTDPTEGAALGMAILDWLGQHKVRTIVTTHYGALKAYAHTREGMENASMEFDWLTLCPTYRLLIGVPGSSNAIKIAERLGMPEPLAASAKSYIGNQTIAVEDLIVSMQESQRELEAEREIVQGKIRDADAAYQKHQELVSRFEAERERLKDEAEKEAAEVLKNARRLVEGTIAEVRREQASKESIRSAFIHIEKAQNALEQSRQRKSPMKKAAAFQDVQIGDKVRLKSLNRFGEILSISNGKASLTVQVGNMRMQVSHEEIEIASPQDNRPQLSPSVLDIQYNKVGTVKTELNLQGKMVSEALEETDKYLDDAFLAGLARVRIVHGKGTGALRAAIHDLLRQHPLASSFQVAPLNEGGEGATVVTLKE